MLAEKFWIFKFFLSKSKQNKFAILISKQKVYIVNNFKTRIVLNWKHSAIFDGTKDKIAWKFSI